MRSLLSISLFLTSQLVFAQSGIIWDQTIEVAPSQFSNMHPRVAVDGAGAPLIIWGNGNSQQVFFTRLNGNGFASPINLNPDTIPIFAASWAGPDLAAQGDTVYVVFKETPEQENGIYLVHSKDGGLTFSAPQRVDAIGDSISRFPSVSMDATGNPLIAFMKFNPGWGDARYVLAKSEDLGITFSTDVPGSGFSGGDVCDCCPATVVSSGNNTALLYRDNLNNLRNSWAGISYDGGISFTGGIEIDDTDWMISACPSSGPDGIIIGDSLFTVFMSGASGKILCYQSRSTLSTLQLESIEPLTGVFAGLGQQNFPRIATSGRAAAIVWTQTVNGSAQLAIKYTDNIANGFPPGYEVLAPNNVENADVAFSSTEVYVVWEDNSSGKVNYKHGTYIFSGVNQPSDTPGSIQILPNPASSSGFLVQFDRAAEEQLTYTIFNSQGQNLISGSGQTMDGAFKVDTSNLPAGLIFIRIKTPGLNFIRSVVVERN